MNLIKSPNFIAYHANINFAKWESSNMALAFSGELDMKLNSGFKGRNL